MKYWALRPNKVCVYEVPIRDVTMLQFIVHYSCNWCDKQGPVIKIHSCQASLAPPFIGLLSFSFYFMMPAAAGWSALSAVLGWAAAV